MVLKWFSIACAFPFEFQVFFSFHNSLNNKAEMIGNVLTGSFKKKLGIHAWKVDFDFNPAFPLEFRFFICIFFYSEVSNCRHKLHDRKYIVSSFQKMSEWENPWCTRGFVWLLFDLSNFEFFFPPFISLLKTTREAEVVTVLPRFRFERDELQHNKQWHTKRQLASLVTYSCWNMDSSRKKKQK